MNELKVFQNPEFGSIRTIQIDGEPWFVGKDVAQALGYGDGKSLNNAVANHVDSEDKGVTEMMTPGGNQNMAIINESGLYSLILSSKLPNAKKFKRWVTAEVLPAIRKTGTYTTSESALDLQTLSPELRTLINLELQQKEQAKALEAVNQKVDGIRDVVALSPNSWRPEARNLITRIARKMGGNEYIREVQSEIHKLVDERAGVSLETRLTNKRRRMADEGICKSKRDKLNKVDVIADDKKLIEIYIAIVKEMAVKYGVGVENESA